MPRIIDHDVERRRIAEATWEVLRSGGPESLTVRNIARQANCTTGTLSHYFRNRGELIAFSYELLVTDLIDSLDRKAPKLAPGLARLRLMLELLIPKKHGNGLSEGVVTISSWVFAISDPELAEQHRLNYARIRRVAADYVQQAIDQKELPADTLPDDIGDMMISFADGMCVAVMIEKELFPPKRRLRLIDQFMLGLGRLTA